MKLTIILINFWLALNLIFQLSKIPLQLERMNDREDKQAEYYGTDVSQVNLVRDTVIFNIQEENDE